MTGRATQSLRITTEGVTALVTASPQEEKENRAWGAGADRSPALPRGRCRIRLSVQGCALSLGPKARCGQVWPGNVWTQSGTPALQVAVSGLGAAPGPPGPAGPRGLRFRVLIPRREQDPPR